MCSSLVLGARTYPIVLCSLSRNTAGRMSSRSKMLMPLNGPTRILAHLVGLCTTAMQESVLYGSAKRRKSGGSGATMVFDTEVLYYPQFVVEHPG